MSNQCKTIHDCFSGPLADLVMWVLYLVGAPIVALPNQETLRRQLQAAAEQAHLNMQYTTSIALGAVIFALVLDVFPAACVGALGVVFGK